MNHKPDKQHNVLKKYTFDRGGIRMKRTRRLVALSVLLAVGFTASSALAFHERKVHNVPHSKADPSGGKLDNGKTSITKLVPPITKIFDYSGSIWERSTMFGDLGGLRTELYEKGFTFDAQLTQVYQGVVSGGSAAGKGRWKYNGLLEINSTLDTAKLDLWSGGLITFTAQTSFGNPLQSEAGNLSPVNMTPLWPKPFDTSTELMEYYLTQGLPHEMALIVGRIDATNFLDKNSFANIPESQFLNASLNNQLLWGEFMEFSTYAALFIAPVTKGVKIAVGYWTPETEVGHYDGDWSEYGLVANPMLDYHLGGLAGAVQVAIAYSSADTVALDHPHLVLDVVTGNTPTKDDNWIISIVGEQYLWTPEGASVPRAKGGRKEDFFVPAQDFTTNPPGIGLFYRLGYTPEDRNPYNWNLSGGLGARGIIPGRPLDRMGIGIYAMFASDDLNDSKFLDGQLDDETGIEAFYNFAITPWLQLSADVQWIDPGIKASDDDTWVLGTRLFTRF
jgi:porin